MKIFITICAVILLMLNSCGNASNNSADKKQQLAVNLEMDYAETADTTILTIGDHKEPAGRPSTDPDPDWDKKIIRTATLDVEVKDFNGYYTRVREQIKNLGGYIASEEQNQNDWKIENLVTLKVPAVQFENAVSILTGDVLKLNVKRISSQDVTGEFFDTKSRLEAKKRVRDRYIGLLNQAKNMTEILDVQSEINDIQLEIESATGRIGYLSQAATFSTITLGYHQVLNPSAKGNDDPGFGSQLSGAFKTGWKWVGELFVGLVSVWPLVLLVIGIILLFRKKRNAKPQPVVL